MRTPFLYLLGALGLVALPFLPGCRPSSDKPPAGARAAISTDVTDLQIPWELVFLPDGSRLLTERPGRLVHLAPDGTRRSLEIAGVDHGEKGNHEGGLLGLALHPRFDQNRWIYLYFTTRRAAAEDPKEVLENRIERYRLAEPFALEDRREILTGIPSRTWHCGGRLRFGPDGCLYVTVGDAGQRDAAQNRDSLRGKILRLRDDGSVPADNPFPDSPVWSLGHRNVQGLAWDGEGRLWATEFGNANQDELNLIEPGANYGWPLITGSEAREGLRSPRLESGSHDGWAPSGICFHDGRLFFVGLKAQALYEVSFDSAAPGGLRLREHFKGRFGRLRAVTAGPDGALYLLTNNRDSRGESRPTDEVVRLELSALVGPGT